ncbi:DUF1919 domain-containing protein [Bisgaard Taxon 45]
MIKNILYKIFRFFLLKKYRAMLKNKSMSVLSSNCTGAMILHDLGVKFNSPFVNLWMQPKDFIKYVEELEIYQYMPLIESIEEKPYPVGLLKDIKIHFQHYKSFEEAKKKWEARSKRINKDNLFIMMSERDGCTYEDLVNFNRLSRKNKVVFTRKKYPEIESSFSFSEYENQKELGHLFERKGLFGKKIYDQFPYVEWFNTGKIKANKY